MPATWEDDVRQLRAAGFSHEEIAAEGSRLRGEMQGAGFTQEELDEFFMSAPVDAPVPEKSALQEIDSRALRSVGEGDERVARTPAQMFEAGFDVSVSGLVGGRPDRFLAENPGLGERLLFSAGILAGDLPAAITGGVLGAIPGAKGGKVGAVIGGGAGSMALPEGIRRGYLDFYEQGAPDSAREYAERVGAVFWDAGKGAVLGGATAGFGQLAKGGTKAVGAGVAGQNTAQLTTEAATMVAGISVMEGELPTRDTVIDAAASVVLMKAGMKAGSKATAKLQKITEKNIIKEWTETGVPVHEIAKRAQADTALRERLLLDDPTLAAQGARVVGDELGGEITITPMKTEGFEGKPLAIDPTGTLTPDQSVNAQFTTRPSDRTLGNLSARAYKEIFDDQHAFNRMVDFMTNPEKPIKGQEVKTLMESTRFSTPRAEFFMRRGFEDKKIPGLDAIVPKDKEAFGNWQTLVRALHAEELHAKGIENPVPREAAQQAIGKLSKDKALMKKAREFTAFNNAMLDELVDAGMITRDRADAWIAEFPFYAPFLRDLGEASMPGVNSAGSSKRVFQPKKAQKGSEKRIFDPLESSVMQTYSIVKAADRNKAALALIELAEANPELAAGWVKKKPNVSTKVQATGKELKKAAGDDIDLGGILDDDTLTLWRSARESQGKDDIVVYRDGKPELWTVDPEVAKFISGLERPDLGLVSRVLAPFNRVLKGGITLSPEFPVVQFARDNPWQFIFDPTEKFPFESFVAGTLDMFGDNVAYKEWQKKGGAIATFRSIGQDYNNADFSQRYGKFGVWATTRNVVSTPMQALRMWADFYATAPRVGKFKLAKKRGATDIEALAAARRSQIDFTRQGSVARELNRFIPFFSPALQATDQMVRAAIANPGLTAARATAMITVPVILAWAEYRNEEWYKEMPQWQKDQSVPIRVGNTTYLFPLPPGVSVLFGGLPRRALEAFADENPRAADGIAESLLTSMTPAIQISALTPFVEHAANHSFFRDRPVVADSVKDALPADQYTAYTSETAKMIASAIGEIPLLAPDGVSPIVLEHYVNAWTGSAGRHALQIADDGLRAAGVIKKPAPPKQLKDTPFFGRFVMRNNANADSLTLFYENLNKHRAVMGSIRLTQGRIGIEPGAPERLAEIIQENHKEMVFLAGVSQTINEQRLLITRINANPDMTDDEKLRLTDMAYDTMVMLARSANEAFEEVGKALEEAE